LKVAEQCSRFGKRSAALLDRLLCGEPGGSKPINFDSCPDKLSMEARARHFHQTQLVEISSSPDKATQYKGEAS
jgi:hypothetical protein